MLPKNFLKAQLSNTLALFRVKPLMKLMKLWTHVEHDCHNLFSVRSVGMFGFPAPPLLATCSQTLYVADQGDISQDSGETVKPGGQPEESVAENYDTVMVEVLPRVQAEGGMCHTSTFTYRGWRVAIILSAYSFQDKNTVKGRSCCQPCHVSTRYK